MSTMLLTSEDTATEAEVQPANLPPAESVSSTGPHHDGGASCDPLPTTSRFFETMSKRRRGFPSETHVKRGVRIVHGDKLLEEKLGRNDPCPCGSSKQFRSCCLKSGRF